MSAYTVVQIEIKDGKALGAALKSMGYQFESHEVAQNLYGYHGDKRSQKANIIVRRKHVGQSANDIGFLKKSDGSYEMIISEFDRGQGKQSTDFMQKLNQEYSKEVLIKSSKMKGWMVISTTRKDGKIKLKVMVP